MKRRQFLQNIAAAGAMPALPGASLMGGMPVSEAVYERAVYLTRLWGASVPEMYTSALGLDLEEARLVFRRLVAERVMGAPNASGIASAIAPYFKVSAASVTMSEGTGAQALSDRFVKDAGRKLATDPGEEPPERDPDISAETPEPRS